MTSVAPARTGRDSDAWLQLRQPTHEMCRLVHGICCTKGCGAVCEDLRRFLDGEIDASDASRFRRHLSGCAACSDNLVFEMALGARLSALLER